MKNHIIILHTATKNSKRLNFVEEKKFWSLFCEKEERKGMISKKLEEKNLFSVSHLFGALLCFYL